MAIAGFAGFELPAKGLPKTRSPVGATAPEAEAGEVEQQAGTASVNWGEPLVFCEPSEEQKAGKLGFEGVVSKTINAPYAPGNRGLWRKSKCLNRQEFVVVGWTDPEGSRPHLGALLLGYYTDGGRLIYAGRVGTGMQDKMLADLRRRLEPLARKTSPLSAPPPQKTRFGSPLVLSRVHWVEPQLSC
jgi:ATP-dependent DNA ligase